MSLKARINDDMKAAMKAREAERLATIRLLLAAMKQKEVDERIEAGRRRHHCRGGQNAQSSAGIR